MERVLFHPASSHSQLLNQVKNVLGFADDERRMRYKSLAIILILSLMMAVCLVAVHNHFADQGRQYDPNCPLCRILLGFVLLLATLGWYFSHYEIATVLICCDVQSIEHAGLHALASRAPPLA